ncbi:hypothetical protein LO762_25670 [Actinocorallia sp. API 0066]|uniref:hypothetical protein n=1 Tax=Actinocorallia sp. API 0066 TaxID=2896846 RepID=UPI001E313936|nr:hypothetical protein [Actinocorallia sp. API 0066]MCD0452548.1 hypothetical protein [Actinocorallia sp. API 0066]
MDLRTTEHGIHARRRPQRLRPTAARLQPTVDPRAAEHGIHADAASDDGVPGQRRGVTVGV